MDNISIPQKESARRDGRFSKKTTAEKTISQIGGGGQAPFIAPDSLIKISGDKDKTQRKSLLIESKAVDVLQEALKEFYSYDSLALSWHEFKGSHWQILEPQQQIDAVILSLLTIGAGDLGYRPAYKTGIKSMLADGNKLPLSKADNSKLPFTNGILDLTTKRLEAITPMNAQTWCLPYAYTPGADCPRTKAWLLQSVDDDHETVQLLRAWIAAVLHGRYDLHKLLHFKGSGGTGKSTFIRLLMALVGKNNAVQTNLKQLEDNRFEAAMLYNKRLAVIADSDKYGGSINNLKAITGGDSVRLERKNQQQSGSFVFQGLVVMASNESMQTTDHTSGLDRRRITVIFNRRVTDQEKQQWERQGGEEAVLHSELPGIVNWALELSQEEIAQIIRNPPERIREADLDAMTATNPIADWLIENTDADPEAWTQIGDKREIKEPGCETVYENADSWLYANFLQWCQRSGKTPFSVRKFKELVIQTSETLGRSVYSTKRNVGQVIHGLRLKDEPLY